MDPCAKRCLMHVYTGDDVVVLLFFISAITCFYLSYEYHLFGKPAGAIILYRWGLTSLFNTRMRCGWVRQAATPKTCITTSIAAMCVAYWG